MQSVRRWLQASCSPLRPILGVCLGVSGHNNRSAEAPANELHGAVPLAQLGELLGLLQVRCTPRALPSPGDWASRAPYRCLHSFPFPVHLLCRKECHGTPACALLPMWPCARHAFLSCCWSCRRVPESFAPVCLPTLCPSAFHYAHISYVTPEICVALISPNPHSFSDLKAVRCAGPHPSDRAAGGIAVALRDGSCPESLRAARSCSFHHPQSLHMPFWKTARAHC